MAGCGVIKLAGIEAQAVYTSSEENQQRHCHFTATGAAKSGVKSSPTTLKKKAVRRFPA